MNYGKQVLLIYRLKQANTIQKIINVFEDSGFGTVLSSKVSILFINKTVHFESSLLCTVKTLRVIDFDKCDILEMVIEFENDIELMRIKKSGNKTISPYITVGTRSLP